LLPHIKYKENSLLIRSSGLPVIEQIIALRSWLFRRIYWNSPNRSLIAMVRFLIYELRNRCQGFEKDWRKVILEFNIRQNLEFFEERTKASGLGELEEIATYLNQIRPVNFDELFELTRAGSDIDGDKICEVFEGKQIDSIYQIQKDINQRLESKFFLKKGSIHILLDYPKEIGARKLGEDLNILPHDGREVKLTSFSGIVKGVQETFKTHLQRFRVFINPNISENNLRKDISKEIQDYLNINFT